MERAGKLQSMFFVGEGRFPSTLRGHGTVLLQRLPFSRLADRIQLNHYAAGSSQGVDSAFGVRGIMFGGRRVRLTMTHKHIGTIVVLILGTVFSIAGGVAGFGFGKPILDKAKASNEWPSTDGKVIESELERHRGNEGETMYKALVVYEYSLDGGEFESDRVWFGGGYSTSDRSEMQAVVKEYPVGKNVTVYYSPDDPGEAVLKPGAYFSSYLLFGGGLIFFTIGSLMLLGLVARWVMAINAVGTSGSHANTFGTDMFDNGRDSFGIRDSGDTLFTDSFPDHSHHDDDGF